jgi:hypothetical protein
MGLTPATESPGQGDSEGPSPTQICRTKRHMARTRRARVRLRRWAIPASVALTEGIIVIFFSSP